MTNASVIRGSFCGFRKDELARLKSKVKRRGVWFKALSRIDRVLIDLAIEVTDHVRSFKLAKELWSVVRKMKAALENKVSQTTKKIGFPLARKLSMLAQNWGNELAEKWISDPLFARFLAILHINSFGTSSQRSAIDTG